ncbi:tautomerase family protein [Enterococcus hulanensis]|uniref:Tautomerase family protein n=1 Tax=Enterococcus hulanensis TaxID=2559929 RepID=A0ABU3F0X1_9ENTE|nr:tautomerase family protein [Enterococcus hulanensis]MDT2599791.1 tautomerase family protein [Enterococcus hulanensis]MDT2609353.1 tautomerase family protein [Enterococcus hulanensis]MDT2615930.1 tautomerase family protein [Enterococcus hulanensis]MDT2628030.1 tautomerase family protein [Enterococcus hulanensis]MDT2655135.1 tautomerase family protein [Enterococcus hulanensis]
MPLMKIDMIKGRNEDEIKEILDISYQVMLEAFHAPEGDRYQIVTQHESFEMQILDTGLGFERTNQVIVFSLTTRPRTSEEKQNFYSQLVKELEDQLGIKPEDVMINLTVNSDEDWSFGFGRAQFLTGEL